MNKVSVDRNVIEQALGYVEEIMKFPGRSGSSQRLATLVHNTLCTVLVQQPAAEEMGVTGRGGMVKLPTNIEEAEAMEMIGYAYLLQHAPDRLTKQQQQQQPTSTMRATPQPKAEQVADREQLLMKSIEFEKAQAQKYFELYTQVCETAERRLREIVHLESRLAEMSAEQEAVGDALRGRICGYTPGMSRIEVQLPEGTLITGWLELGETVYIAAEAPQPAKPVVTE